MHLPRTHLLLFLHTRSPFIQRPLHHRISTTSFLHSRHDAVESIVTAAIKAVDPAVAVRRKFPSFDDVTSSAKRRTWDGVTVVAFGKASYAMAAAVFDLIPSSVSKVTGLVIAKDGHEPTVEEQEVLERFQVPVRSAAHPVPDERNVEASNELMEVVETARKDNHLVIACISGGGSALLCTPKNVSLDDLQATHTALLESGLSIQDMNVIRKRLERAKGGGLQADVALILSDIIGDPLDLIASGPTVSTPEAEINPSMIRSLLLPKAVEEQLLSEPSPSSGQPNPCSNILVGNNAAAVQAAADEAESLGYNPVVLSTEIEGEASTVGQMMATMAKHLTKSESPFNIRPNLPIALIAGGETTVTLPSSHGLGGRNQELALAAAIALKKYSSDSSIEVAIASVGTDGTDGPTDAAGAIVDETTAGPGANEALAQHDAYNYLVRAKRSDGKRALYKTGPTGTNVADVIVALVEEAKDG